MTQQTILVIGADIPLALVRCAGFEANRTTGEALDVEINAEGVAGVVISHIRADQARIYHRLLARGTRVPIFFLDLPYGSGPSVEAYSQARLKELGNKLVALSGQPIAEHALRRELAAEWATNEHSKPTLTGGVRSAISGASNYDQARDAARRTGTEAVWIEDEEGYGSPDVGALSPSCDPWAVMASMHSRRASTATRGSLLRRATNLLAGAKDNGAETIIRAEERNTDASAWFGSVLRRESGDAFRIDEDSPVLEQVDEERPSRSGRATQAAERPRARKLLTVTADFSEYQREWFATVRQRALSGEPFAMVNADAPQEILRALDIPFVVNQWWASIAAAKGGTSRSRAALRAAGLPDKHETYNSQGIADLLAADDGAPWGGLPVPKLLLAVRNEDAVAGIFQEWARLSGATLILFDRTVESRHEFPVYWWDLMPRQWDTVLETPRLDLMTNQIKSSIPEIEAATGRTLDTKKLDHVLNLVNEQEEWYRRTRDLIAATRPAPVSIVDTIPATMIPQWHRGTEWARDSAKAFHDEVAARVHAGSSVCQQEKIRLMWVGRGLWQHMWLYQEFEESHGAVFVWSMYLGLAADGYLRYTKPGDDPIRALAARFVTVGDELRMPRWAAAWHVEEARRHGVDAVVAIDDAEPFVLDQLELAGFPVLRIDQSNLAEDAAPIVTEVRSFLDGLQEATK